MSSRLAVCIHPWHSRAARATRLILLCAGAAGLTTAHRRACSLGAARALQMTSRHTHPPALPAGARHRGRARTPRGETHASLLVVVSSHLALLPLPSSHATDMRARSTMLVLRDLCRARRWLGARGCRAVATAPRDRSCRGLRNTGRGR